MLRFRFPRLSPDGRLLAVTIDPRPSEIWVYDLERHTQIPVVRGEHSLLSVWSHVEDLLAYRSGGIFVVKPDGTGVPEPLVTDRELTESPEDWSRDGEWFIYNVTGHGSGFEIGVTLSGEGGVN